MDNNDAAYLSFLPLLGLYKKRKNKEADEKKRGEEGGMKQ